MTVEATTSKSGPFIAAGTSGTFPRNFLIFDETHLRVIRVRDGVETDLTTGIGHTGIGSAEGTVVLTAGIQADDVIYLLRAVPSLQKTDYNSQGRVRTEVVERDLDLLQMQVQDVKEAQSRALTLGVASEVTGPDAMAAALAAPIYAAQAKEAAEALRQYDGEFFANSVSPGSFTRLANRVFVGDAWTFSGGTEGNNAVGTWLNSSGGAKVQPGTVSISNGSTTVTGVGTQFLLLAPGKGVVTIGGSVYKIASIASNTSMTLQTAAVQTLGGATFSAGTTTIGWIASSANMLVTNNFGIGVVGAVISGAANRGVFGGSFVGKAAHAGATAWGLYIEALRDHPEASYALGTEIQAGNLYPAVSTGLKPYGNKPGGAVYGLNIASGADPVVNPISYPVDTAMSFSGNGSTFLSGIVFQNDSLAFHSDGRQRAVLLPTLATVSWWDSGNNQVFGVTSSASSAAKAVSVEHNNLGMTFGNGAGHPFLFVNRGPDGVAVDYLGIVAQGSGGPRLVANGTGANVDLNLVPKGNGHVVLPLTALRSFNNDTEAAAGGVPVGGLYRNNGSVMVRLT